MSDTQFRQSGLPGAEHLPWGSHVGLFYSSREDLVEALVPYFSAGLRHDESCLWITSEPLEAGEAEELMVRAVPDFASYLKKGQIEIRNLGEWYVPRQRLDADDVLAAWVERVERAARDGYAGLRLTANAHRLKGAMGEDVTRYEQKVSSAFGHRRVLALCTYSLDECTARDMIDAVRSHDFALARREEDWETIEAGSGTVARDSLARANRELELRVSEHTRELEEALHSRDEFLTMLAHELRNPLAPIRSAAHIVRLLSRSSSRLSSASEVLERQVAHLSRLVDELLDTPRITSGAVTLKRDITSVGALLARALEAARPQISARGHALALTLPPEELRVQVDPTRIEQVLGNLLDNAAKYTPEGGKIEVEAARDGDQALLRVRDTGIGIEPEMLDHIFDLFTRGVPTTGRAGGGLGLGLALVERLVEMHGGTVEARSEGRGKGSEFTVRLPLADSEAASETVAVHAHHNTGRRVLVVDDNLDACRALRMTLELLGHQVEVAHDGASAIAAARRRRPEVVLLDIGLPGIDGYEVARRLRRLPGFANVRLVALTGYGRLEDRRRGRVAGFDAYFVKPISPEALGEVVGVRALH